MLDSKKYQKHVACSYGYKLVFVDDKFGKPFKSHWDKDISYNFINNAIKESIYWDMPPLEKH